MEFIERSNHYLEVKDSVKHFVKFGHVGGRQIRIDIDPVTGAETPSFIAVKNVIEVKKATGDILGIKRNFDPQREILGAEVHSDPLLENVIIEAIDYPSDMQKDDGIINYRYNKVSEKLVKKV